MSCILGGTNKEAAISVKKRIPLSSTEASSSIISKKGKSRASTAQPSSNRRESRSAQPSRNGHRDSSTGFMLPPPLPTPVRKPVPEVSEFQVWAEKAIHSQQEDIERVSLTMERVESTVNSVKTLLEELRGERKEYESRFEYSENGLGLIRECIQQIVEKIQLVENHHNEELIEFSNDVNTDLDPLYDAIGDIRKKANQVDGLKEEIQR